MYMNLGEDYDERVLPSITTEVLKAVVVRFPGCFECIQIKQGIHSQLMCPSLKTCGLNCAPLNFAY